MKIIYNRLIPFRGFTAANLFGVVFARKECRPLSEKTIRHEAIHTAQQREWLFVGFFLLYFVEWLLRGYRGISFEREAYAHEADPDYLSRRKPFANYRR